MFTSRVVFFKVGSCSITIKVSVVFAELNLASPRYFILTPYDPAGYVFLNTATPSTTGS